MGSAKLCFNGNEIGKVRWSYDGSKAVLWASCPYESGYIYRLTVFAGTDKMSLGVMMPKGDVFALCTTLSAHQYKLLLESEQSKIRGEICRNLPGETCASPLPFAFSELLPISSELILQIKVLKYAKDCKAKILYKSHKQRIYLVFKLEIGREVHLTPLFCFITPIFIQGEIYGAICVDEYENFCAIN